jgi:hypothetical protein
MNIEVELQKYLTKKGIHPIWIAGAMRHIRFSTNSWFATKATIQGLKKKGDWIAKMAIHLEVEYPDKAKKGHLSLIYTFDRRRKGNEHRCEYVPATASTFIPL